ncbi:MAG: RcpC/CpaB family pilus assembly protein [Marmoricola sp.]
MTTLTALADSWADRFDRLRRRVLWHRRALAAACCAGAVWAGVHAAAPPPPQTVAVWTTARPLSSGAVLTSADLVRRPFAPGSVPEERLRSPGDVVGRVLARPVGAGAVLTAADVVGDHWLDGRPGMSAVPVRVTDAAAAGLLRVGDRVALLAADPQGREPATTLATDAAVLAVPARAGDGNAALPGRLVVVGVPAPSAATLAAAATRGFLTVVWTR